MTASWPGREAIAERARRRWKRALIAICVLSGLGGVFGGVLGSGTHHHAHHHPSVAASVVLIVITVAVLVGVVWVGRWVWRRRFSRFAAPIMAGLPRRQRRIVLRDIRRGTPNQDETLRFVEIETADRLTRDGRFGWVVFAVVAALVAIELLDSSEGVAHRVFHSALGLFLIVMAIYQFVLLRAARNFLRADPATLSAPSAEH